MGPECVMKIFGFFVYKKTSIEYDDSINLYDQFIINYRQCQSCLTLISGLSQEKV